MEEMEHAHLFRKHLDVCRVIVPYVAFFLVHIQISLFIFILLGFIFVQ